MNRYAILMGFLLVLSSLGFADTITDYKVPSTAPLNQEITVTGIYADGVGGHPLVSCSYYIMDLSGNIVIPLTDQYSTSTGRFRMLPFTLTEPLTVRGQIYNLHSECGTATADANFQVIQKQEAFNVAGFALYPQGAFMDLLYVRDNGTMLFFIFIVIMVFAGLLVTAFFNFF